jgi:Domain of unknown function (DUF4911)
MSLPPPSSEVVPIVLRVPRAEIAYVKFVFESYEGIAVVRTLDRYEARVVILAVPDFLADARAVVAGLVAEAGCEEIAFTPAGGEDWLDSEVDG